MTSVPAGSAGIKLVSVPVRTAIVAPGQGSSGPAMQESVEAHCPELLEILFAQLGADSFERVRESTRFAQPAVFAASIASWREAGYPEATVVAGHSLGEYAALVLNGQLSAVAALKLVIARAQFMEDAASQAPGGMIALLDCDLTSAEILARHHSIVVANENTDRQQVLSGALENLRNALDEALRRGMRPIKLDVTGAFHSPAMRPALQRLRAELDAVAFGAPRCTILTGMTGDALADPPRQLAEALVAPVRWRRVMDRLAALEIRRLIELGPGTVLSGFARSLLPGTEVVSLGATGRRATR